MCSNPLQKSHEQESQPGIIRNQTRTISKEINVIHSHNHVLPDFFMKILATMTQSGVEDWTVLDSDGFDHAGPKWLRTSITTVNQTISCTS